MNKIHKILIANRGEIAIRIHRTASRMGIPTVAVYSKQDLDSAHIMQCDHTVLLQGESIAETYLNIDQLIDIAKRHGCNAIHPGYGFLAENPSFPMACQKHDIIFIGPSPEIIHLMGNKIEANKRIKELGIPTNESFIGTVDEIIEKKDTLPYPVLVKAAAGGGGKGMQIVQFSEDLPEVLESTSRLAEKYFKDSTVYVEHFFPLARHIEVQVLGDHHGNAIHLWERECSLQRRYQKIIEEAPSPTLNNTQRREVTDMAVKITSEIGYTNAGTIEFLMDPHGNFYFLEMNTRIQVEHAVTEMITGIDIVEQQINIAEGKPIAFKQNQIRLKGHAVEARIYAEDTSNGFMPAPGRITYIEFPSDPEIRIETSYEQPGEVHTSFDPMIAKIIAHGDDRTEAIQSVDQAINTLHIMGINTNVGFLRLLLNHADFRSNTIHTRFVENQFKSYRQSKSIIENIRNRAICCAAVLFSKMDQQPKTFLQKMGIKPVLFKTYIMNSNELFELAGSQQGDKYKFKLRGKTYSFTDYYQNGHHLTGVINNSSFHIVLRPISTNEVEFLSRHHQFHLTHIKSPDDLTGWSIAINKHGNKHNLKAPVTGHVSKIMVVPGQVVEEGQELAYINSLSLNTPVKSTSRQLVQEIHIQPGDFVKENDVIFTYKD
ncbi:ATP-grasp domain-containing protein [Puteibacter caeruleilacunae]|nr:ATP-grasp domain-containing protein [Puteibacter caeruleilacunae]